MTIAQTSPQTNTDPSNEIIFPQGEFWSDEPPLESNLHLKQIILLIECLEWLWQDRDDYFAAGNLTVYYSRHQKKSEDFRGPDFFVVLGTTHEQNRKSWVVWQEEGKYPNVIVEILSDSTAKTDTEEKKAIYQEIFRTPDYFWFDPETLEFEGFTLIQGHYQEIEPNEEGWRWSEQLRLYLGIYDKKLRYFTPDGELVPTPQEASSQEKQQKEYERQQKELALQKIEALTARLRDLGINPDETP